MRGSPLLLVLACAVHGHPQEDTTVPSQDQTTAPPEVLAGNSVAEETRTEADEDQNKPAVAEPAKASHYATGDTGFNLNGLEYDTEPQLLPFYPCSAFAPPQARLNVNFAPRDRPDQGNCEAMTKLFLAPNESEHYRYRCKFADNIGGAVDPKHNNGKAMREYGVPLGVTLMARGTCSNFFFSSPSGAFLAAPQGNEGGACSQQMKKLTGIQEHKEEEKDDGKDDDVTATGVGGGFDYFLECSCECEADIPVKQMYPLNERPLSPHTSRDHGGRPDPRLMPNMKDSFAPYGHNGGGGRSSGYQNDLKEGHNYRSNRPPPSYYPHDAQHQTKPQRPQYGGGNQHGGNQHRSNGHHQDRRPQQGNSYHKPMRYPQLPGFHQMEKHSARSHYAQPTAMIDWNRI